MKIIDNREKRHGIPLAELGIGETFERCKTEDKYLKISDLDRPAAFNLDKNCLVDMSQEEIIYQIEATITIEYPSTESQDENTAGGGKTKKRKRIDGGKIKALHDAGWDNEKIADEMDCSIATVYNYLKQEEDGK